REGDVQPSLQWLAGTDPEVRAVGAEARVTVLAVVGEVHLHDKLEAPRLHDARIKRLGAGIVGDGKTDVIEHSLLLALLLGRPRSASDAALDHQLLELGDGLGGVETLGAGFGAVENGMAAIQTEGVF